MEHPCRVPCSTLRNTLQLNRSLGEKNTAYMMSSLSEKILILWGKGEYVFSQWHTLPISVFLLPSRLGYSEFQCTLKATAASKVSWFQDAAPHVSALRRKISAYLKQDLISRVWLIPANFMLGFDVLSLHYLHLIRKTVGGYAMILDAGKILPWRWNPRISFFKNLPIQSTSQSFSVSFCEGS